MEGESSTSSIENIITDSSEQLQTCSYACCHPRGKFHRFIALLFMCFLGFGSYFCYDNPAALQDYFIKDLNITTTQFSLLYSLYSWPTVIVCFIGGILLDSVFGIRLGTNIYMAITLLGQVVFASGALFNLFWMMTIGRFLFGIGAEPLAVAQNNYAVLWFKGKELNMVFGLQLSFARFGSAVNFWVIEPIYSWVSKEYTGYECLGIVLFIAGLTCVFSMICSLILGCIDKRADRILDRSLHENQEVVRLKDIYGFQLTFWLITLVCVTYYVAIFPFISLAKVFFMQKFHMSAHSANLVNSLVYLVSAFAAPILGFAVDKTGKNVFWIIFGICATIVAHCILSFTMINPYLVGHALLDKILISSDCQSIQNLGLALATYAAGAIVDKWGYTWLEVFFIANLSVSLVASLIIWIVDSTKAGILNMTPKQRELHQQKLLATERLEREKLLSSSSSSTLQPASTFQIRNRYLSRIGAPLPSHYDIHTKGLAYRALR